MFHQRSATEVLPGYDNITRFRVRGKILIQPGEQVRLDLLHLFQCQTVHQFLRENLVTRDIIHVRIIPYPVHPTIIIAAQHHRLNGFYLVFITRSLEMNHRRELPAQSGHGNRGGRSNIFLNTGGIRTPDIHAVRRRYQTTVPCRGNVSDTEARSATRTQYHRARVYDLVNNAFLYRFQINIP